MCITMFLFDLGFLEQQTRTYQQILYNHPGIKPLLKIPHQRFQLDSNSLQAIAHDLDIEVSGSHQCPGQCPDHPQTVQVFPPKIEMHQY